MACLLNGGSVPVLEWRSQDYAYAKPPEHPRILPYLVTLAEDEELRLCTVVLEPASFHRLIHRAATKWSFKFQMWHLAKDFESQIYLELLRTVEKLNLKGLFEIEKADVYVSRIARHAVQSFLDDTPDCAVGGEWNAAIREELRKEEQTLPSLKRLIDHEYYALAAQTQGKGRTYKQIAVVLHVSETSAKRWCLNGRRKLFRPHEWSYDQDLAWETEEDSFTALDTVDAELLHSQSVPVHKSSLGVFENVADLADAARLTQDARKVLNAWLESNRRNNWTVPIRNELGVSTSYVEKSLAATKKKLAPYLSDADSQYGQPTNLFEVPKPTEHAADLSDRTVDAYPPEWILPVRRSKHPIVHRCANPDCTYGGAVDDRTHLFSMTFENELRQKLSDWRRNRANGSKDVHIVLDGVEVEGLEGLLRLLLRASVNTEGQICEGCQKDATAKANLEAFKMKEAVESLLVGWTP